MTFKRLKISVAISLTLFILIIGNIFIFSIIQKISLTENLKEEQESNFIIPDIREEYQEKISNIPTEINKNNQEKTSISQISSSTTNRKVKHRITRAS